MTKAAPWKTGRKTKNTYERRPRRRTPKRGTKRALLIELLRGAPRSAVELADLCRCSRDGVWSSMLMLEGRRIVRRIQTEPGQSCRWALTTATRATYPPSVESIALQIRSATP